MKVDADLVCPPRSLRELTRLKSLKVPMGMLGGKAEDPSEEVVTEPPPEPASLEARAQQLEDALAIPSIKRLELSFAEKTELELPESVGTLKALRHLKIRCFFMYPNSTGVSLTQLPASLGALSSLMSLTISALGLSSLPDSLGNLSSLRLLRLDRLSLLTALPESIGKLAALEDLDIVDCPAIRQLPSSLGSLRKLGTIVVADNARFKVLFGGVATPPALESLPDSLGNLPALHTLVLGALPNLKALPDSFSRLTSLEVRCCSFKDS